jgi:tRNA-specific 2-thiouridylase
MLRAVDATKDQTYFLHQLTQEQLAPAKFPVGELTKRTVRSIAREQGIPTFAKKDSTGICFIGERPFRDFLARYLPREPGPIETPEGEVLGRHGGLAYHTLGQRQGLGLGGRRGGSDEPWFVAAKDRTRNALVVVQGRGDPRLYASTIELEAMHWITGRAPAPEHGLTAKTRYRMTDAACRIESFGADRWRASFDAPQWAPTPGQYLVMYDGEVCLGGGVITSTRRDDLLQSTQAAVEESAS